MAFRDTPPESAKGSDASAPGKNEGHSRRRGSSGFDRWLTERLHDVYDPVLKEKVPDEFDRLLDDFAKRPNGHKK
jgi:hypothetical protein